MMVLNLLLPHAPRDTSLQPQKTKLPTNSALFVVLPTAKSETSAFINRNIRDSYASRIKFVGTMGRDFKKKGTIPYKTGRLVTLPTVIWNLKNF
jgi:hypothetical protein